jgi:hypothetical protein
MRTQCLPLPRSLPRIAVRIAVTDNEGLLSEKTEREQQTGRSEGARHAPILTCIGLMACIFALNLYRAVTQSLTTDEAYTWSLYLTKDLRTILTHFDANNHVLFTLLSWLSVRAFGDAEWAIRLPSVIGSLVYVFAAWRLTRANVLWTLALTLNPLMLDFLSAGRGYGLATSLLLLSLDSLLRDRLTLAGVAAGLAIAANLSVALPIAAITLVFAYQRRRELWPFIDRYAVLAIVTAFIFVAVPLAYAKPGAFYVGSDTLANAARTMWIGSFGRDWSWTPWVLGIVLAAAGLRAGVFGAIFWGTITVNVLAYYAVGLRYPEFRTGLYLIPLATLMLMHAARQFVLVALVLIAIYAVQFRTDYYFEWAHDRSTRAILERLGREAHDARPKQIVVSWVLESAVNYYREHLHLGWMNPVDRRPPDSPADLYLLLPGEHTVIAERGLRVLWEDPKTQIRVATSIRQ